MKLLKIKAQSANRILNIWNKTYKFDENAECDILESDITWLPSTYKIIKTIEEKVEIKKVIENKQDIKKIVEVKQDIKKENKQDIKKQKKQNTKTKTKKKDKFKK